MAVPSTPLISEYKDYTASYIAGCDESGAGAIVGPVVAAAVILPKDFYDEELYSNPKKLSVASRIRLNAVIRQRAITLGIAVVDHQTIDQMGIMQAIHLVMHKAIEQLKTNPDQLLIAGRSFVPYKKIPYQCILKGNRVYPAIAAANIVAKVYRDQYIDSLDRDFPAYGWRKNKGYSTPSHKSIIKALGATFYHRKSFDFQG
ncbi:MAG TPA: ribonuclease HII [Amoebophilaceae bacterium]|nr:ribonuclease HII [Amoebophilaceae bacterium]